MTLALSKVWRTAVATAVTAVAFGIGSTAHAKPFSDLYVFGDSLMDVGNLYAATGTPASPPYYNGRVSNGPLFVEQFAASYGKTLTPSLTGGNGWAWAGATTGSNAATGVPDVLDQINAFKLSLGGALVDPQSLVILDGGGNDVAAALASATPAAVIGAALANTGSELAALASVGAKRIVLFNVPNIGATPRVRELDAALGQGGALQAGATALTQAFNTGLLSVIAGAEAAFGLDIELFDLYALNETVRTNPAYYGLTNVQDACLTAAGVCADPSQYLYWDNFHPTERTGQIIAASLRAAVPEPATMALFAVSLGLLGWTRRRSRS
jgi:outer membrane lipase/esterase